MTQQIAVTNEAAHQRLDLFLTKVSSITRSQIKILIQQGLVMVNQASAPARYIVKPGDLVEWQVVTRPTREKPQNLPDIAIVYQDDDLIILDKPAGLITHPGAGTTAETVTMSDIAQAYTTDTDSERPGIVHRLDKDTSGLIMIAKSSSVKKYLQQELAERRIHKTYTALLIGRVEPASAIIRLPISRDPRRPLQRAVNAQGLPAETSYTTVATYPGYTLVHAKPVTGRTHQLRVHFAAIGHPIAGDVTYGHSGRPEGLARQFLHASRLELTGPSGQSILAECQLPMDLQQYLSRLDNLV